MTTILDSYISTTKTFIACFHSKVISLLIDLVSRSYICQCMHYNQSSSRANKVIMRVNNMKNTYEYMLLDACKKKNVNIGAYVGRKWRNNN